MVLGRAAPIRVDGGQMNVLVVDARKAVLNPRCEEDVYSEWPEECGLGKDWCGKLKYW